MNSLPVYLWVGLGSAVGGISRVWLTDTITRWWGAGFPLGTVVVNFTGSFLIGLLAGWGAHDPRWVSSRSAQFLMAGVCGGYTTFSTFSLQTFLLLRTEHWSQAAANVLLSLLLCLAGVWAGFALGHAWGR